MSASSNNILIHIGFPKTGTSWLQSNLFIEKNGFCNILKRDKVFEYFIVGDPLNFEADNVRNKINDKISKTSLYPVISSEQLTGNPFIGGRDAIFIANNIHAVYPNAKILVTIRNQFDYLVSFYKQYLRVGGRLPPSKLFLDKRKRWQFGFLLEFVEYDRLIGLYIKQFGAENVLVIEQELLFKQKEKEIKRIIDFCDLHEVDVVTPDDEPRNVGTHEFVSPILRRINYFRSKILSEDCIFDLGIFGDYIYGGVSVFGRSAIGKKLFGTIMPVSNLLKTKFEKRFDESNKRLSKMLSAEIYK